LSLKSALITLNKLVELNIIGDYAIAGGYAAIYYDIPYATYDLDVIVVLQNEDDYSRLWAYFRDKGARIEHLYIFVDDMPVQFLPNYISPLYNQAIEEAIIVEFDDVRSKYVSLEYLIALFLTAFREKDKIRIDSLLKNANKNKLETIIKRFGNDQNQLHARYREILGREKESS